MDRKLNRWSWVKEAMPRVTALVVARRKRDGDAWVNQCWQRGVIEREPGWFWAYEAGIAIGVPSAEQLADPVVLTCKAHASGLALLFTKEREAVHGAH